jgi:hypothetical protein
LTVVLFRIYAGASREKLFDRAQATCPRRRHERGLAARELRSWIGAGLEEKPDDASVAIHTGNREWRHSVTVGGCCVGAGRDQAPRQIFVIVIYGPMKSRHAIDLWLVHGVALRE